jgi:hypothetical protein
VADTSWLWRVHAIPALFLTHQTKAILKKELEIKPLLGNIPVFFGAVLSIVVSMWSRQRTIAAASGTGALRRSAVGAFRTRGIGLTRSAVEGRTDVSR